MNDSSAIILRRQHSIGLDTHFACVDVSMKKIKNEPLHYNNAPHQTVEYRLRGICIIAGLSTVMKKGPRCVYCVCQMTFNMVTRIISTAAKGGWVNPDEAVCLASHSGSIRQSSVI